MPILNNSLLKKMFNRTFLIWLAGIVLVYFLYISGISTNPPGSYLDESCLAYNGYLISQTGASESGTTFPLFFQCYTQSLIQYMHPTNIYLLAVMNLFVSPSVVSGRILAATTVFAAALLLGLLAFRISRRRLLGCIVALTALATPWLFEIGRLVQETFVLIFSVVLFLFCLYNASRREKWKLSDSFWVAISLALITYSYPSGRILAPAFAFGMLIFVVANRQAFLGIVKTWSIYFVTFIPLIVVYFTNGDVMTKRFREVTYILPDKPWSSILPEFVSSFLGDISPGFLLFKGDPLIRHHVQSMGEILIVTFVLAIFGIVLIFIRHRRDPWWWFILFGLFVSILPGAIGTYRHHALRLLALPIFLLVLTVPTLTWLISESVNQSKSRKLAGQIILVLLMALTLGQTVMFQSKFRELGPNRGHFFDASYPRVLNEALAQPSRPIYLKDGYWGPGYIHAYWYGTIAGVDLSNFVHLAEKEMPPPDAVVLSSDNECSNCEKILQDDSFLLYRTLGGNGAKPKTPEAPTLPPITELKNPAAFGGKGAGPGQQLLPRGIAVDSAGNIYVADTGNARIQKFNADGNFVSSFGTAGTGEGEMKEPNGIAIDPAGDIYVTEVIGQKLMKFKPDGTFVKDWKGPEPGFYGPRDIAFGPNKQLYIVDQGQLRIVRFDPVTETFTLVWGGAGSAQGKFGEPTGICMGGNFVFVADTGNKRVQVFDLEGKFVREFGIPSWDNERLNYPDVAFDEQSKHLYISSGGKQNQLLAFDDNGNLLGNLKPQTEPNFDSPSSMVISEVNKKSRLLVLNTGSGKVVTFEIEPTTKPVKAK